ncbi:SOS response-associated peptidase [Tateyamaria omphalii]|uniref:SOS response-associated peptidase n=1 Tax=Tateyamaria omphalii TaxID=299262 RepID=UPI00167BEE7B|nr:SOS response-associated peptidase [Tateyamaria omphalii]
MCGRFSISLAPEDMSEMFAAVAANDMPDVPNFNVCPTDSVHTVTYQRGQRWLAPMRWGFIPHWYKTPTDGPLLINARSETIAEKPAFRNACRERRAAIPASGFYEWTREGETRLPWYITRSDGAPLVFAAVWQEWKPKEEHGDRIRAAAIVTTAANKSMSSIHHRMPVVLEPEDVALWLGEKGKGAATLMRAAPDDLLMWHRVDSAVNSNRASGSDLITPVDA